jgi:hypothetical protein
VPSATGTARDDKAVIQVIRRLFWLSLGAVLGAWTVLRVQRFARQFGPRGVAARAVGVGAALREFAADVRSQMRLREAELRRVLDATPAARQGALPAGRNHNLDIHHTNHHIDKDGH